MSSTQGHTNINTIHTTIDISVLLGEINRIADESYSKGFECGYDVGMEKGKADGVRDFLAWYSGGETMPSFGRYAKCNIDDVIAEWQKGAENDRNM